MGLIDWTIANKSRIDVHRWAFLFSYAIYTTAWIIYFRLYYYFRESTPTESTDNFRLSIIWISRILAVLSSPFLIFQMIGFLTFYPKWATYDLEEPKNLEADFPPVVFRVVSRGDDVAVLQRGIEFHTAILKRLGATKWLYQLVVEQPNDIAGENIEVIVVPKLYATPNKTLYKGKLLQFQHNTLMRISLGFIMSSLNKIEA